VRASDPAGEGGGTTARTWTALEVVRWIAADLARRGVPSARLDAELLVAHALGTSRVGLYVRHDAPLTEAERARVREALRRRRAGEPVAYIVGEKEFWTVALKVDRRVLVPRPETEVLVEEALGALGEKTHAWRVADVGTGSGAVAIVVARERPAAVVTAVDVSAEALDLARENAARHGVADRVEFVHGDGAESLAGRPAAFDAVLANLPYVPSGEIARLAVEIREHEPRRAIDGGADGLREIRRTVPAAGRALRPGGLLALEIGADQEAPAREVVEGAGLFRDVRLRRDYAGLARVVAARRREDA
jgi:release factor glutamine methyltransferase